MSPVVQGEGATDRVGARCLFSQQDVGRDECMVVPVGQHSTPPSDTRMLLYVWGPL